MMKLLLLIAVAASTAVHGRERPTLAPPAAVALADALRNGGSGRFEMTVVSTGMVRDVLFLNSGEDYRAPDDLIFEIAPNIARELAERFGAPPEIYLKGKHIIVDGTVRRVLIVNSTAGVAFSANRWQHVVRIEFAKQLVSIDG